MTIGATVVYAIAIWHNTDGTMLHMIEATPPKRKPEIYPLKGKKVFRNCKVCFTTLYTCNAQPTW